MNATTRSAPMSFTSYRDQRLGASEDSSRPRQALPARGNGPRRHPERRLYPKTTLASPGVPLRSRLARISLLLWRDPRLFHMQRSRDERDRKHSERAAAPGAAPPPPAAPAARV